MKTNIFKGYALLSFLIALLITFLVGVWQYAWYTTFNVEILLVVFIVNVTGIFILLYFIIKPYFDKMLARIEAELEILITQKDIQPENILEEKSEYEKVLKQIRKIKDERLKEQEHFKKADSYRKEYLGNLSHELKTPVFNVQGYLSTLLDGAWEEKHILLEYLKKADKNIERMINIIDDLETISQLESGALHLDIEKFDIVVLCKEIFEQMELQAQKKNIKLAFKKKYPLYFVFADKYRIRQVLINLVSNSIKYGKEGGTTIIELTPYQNQIIISISDNGIGISSNHLQRIFERFYRVDKGRSREQGGTGLGLAIVKHIIEAHKQTIDVKSEVDVGTAFSFTLSTI